MCPFKISCIIAMADIMRARENALDLDTKQDVLTKAKQQILMPGLCAQYNDEYSDPDSDLDDESETEESLDDLLDIDIRNLDQPDKLPRYAETIFTLAQEEIQTITSSTERITAVQMAIDPARRTRAIKWMFQIQRWYSMSSDTLFEAVTYFNIVLSNRTLTDENFQLYAVTCVWMAAKIEEREPPKLSELQSLCSQGYNIDDFVTCERDILQILDYRLNYPTSKMFLRRLLDVIDAEADIIEVAYFFCDLSLVYLDTMDFSPDVVALACSCLGKVCLDQFCPTKRMMIYGHIDDVDAAKLCAQRLVEHAVEIMKDVRHFLYEKYTVPELTGAVKRMILTSNVISEI